MALSALEIFLTPEHVPIVFNCVAGAVLGIGAAILDMRKH